MLATLLEATGRSVGLATSPHLEHVRERVVWNGDPIDDASLARVLTQIEVTEEFLTELPSYFEIMVAAGVHVLRRRRGPRRRDRGRDGRARGTRRTSSTPTSRSSPTSGSTTWRSSARPAPRSPPTRRASSVRTPRSCSARPIRSWCRSSRRASRRAPGCATATSGSGVSRLAHGGHLVDLYTPDAEYPEVFVPVRGAHQVDKRGARWLAARRPRRAPLDEERCTRVARVTSRAGSR